MIITKCAKRLMATVMTTALVLTGLVVAPKEVSAAEGDPTVEVLGATLRLDAESGTQSMRVGIQIKNATAAKKCGITLSLGGKSLEISTDKAEYQNIYNYNEENDALVYTAVIKNIPKDNFTDKIGVQGSVTEIGTGTVKDTGTAVEKSVSGIAASMNEKDATIELADNGKLVRLIDELGVNEDKTFGSKFTVSDTAVEYDSDKQAYKLNEGNIAWTSNGIGNVTNGGAGDYFCQVTAQGSSSTTISMGRHDGTQLGTDTIDTEQKTICFNVHTESTGYPIYTLVSNAYPLYVKSYKIYKILKDVDLEDIVPDYPDATIPEGDGWTQIDLSKNNGISGVTYDSNSKSLTVKGVGDNGFLISLGDDVKISKDKKVELFIRGNDIGGGLFRVWLNGDKRTSDVASYKESCWSGTYDKSGKGGPFEIICSLTAGVGGESTGDTTHICFKHINAWDASSISKTAQIENIVITTLWYRIVE